MTKYWKTTTWIIIVTSLLLLPGNKLPESSFELFEHADKMVHGILFLILYLLFLIESKWKPIQHKYYPLFISLTLFSAYAFITELLQNTITQNRSGNATDALADIIGLLLGYVMYRYIWLQINRTI